MTMERSRLELERLGDKDLAKIVSGVHEAFKKRHPELNDVSFPSATTSVEKPEQKLLKKGDIFLDYPNPLPQKAVDVVTKIRELGMGGNFAAYHLSSVTLGKDSNFPEWKNRPEAWYWEQIANGKIAPDSAKLPNAYILIDKTPRPNYDNGRQLHENDPFGPLLARLRKDNKIAKLQGIPDTSRFGISPNELTQTVLPEIAKLLGVETSQVRLPKAIEFNILGDQLYPNWGKASTWEWFDDKFGGSCRLLGGRSGNGGLTCVNHDWSGDHYDDVGFRPLVVISPKA